MRAIDLSIVIPVYNSEKTIQDVVEAVFKELSDISVEVVLINDGSHDSSESICTDISRNNDLVQFISLRKNYGEHNAVMCGLNYAEGNHIAIIDDDLQNPPSEIKKLYNEIIKGYDVVYSKYKSKQHGFFRNLGSRFNSFIAGILLDKPKNLYLSSFKILTKGLAQEIIKYQGPFPYVDGLVLRSTNNIGVLSVIHEKRSNGRSNYTFGKLLNLYFNMFFNFSVKPLRAVTISGFIIFLVGITLSIIFVIEKIMNPEITMGWTSIIVAVLTFSGFNAMCLGLIGEYIGKLYLDVNKYPQWVKK